MIRLVVTGAAGRMGKMILSLAAKDAEFKITGAVEDAKHPAVGSDVGQMLGLKTSGVKVTADLDAALKDADAVIDFTHFSVTENHIQSAIRNKVGFVLGTTGLKSSTLELVQKAAREIAVVQAPNMSVGVNLLFRLAELTAGILDEDYDVEIVEAHHRMKKDAPSGTALKLLELIAKARGKDPKKDSVSGREGETGERPRGQIGIHAVRGGDVIGDHTVSFLADGERIELVHKASSRDAFASGALKAAKFVARQPKGLYNMSQVLGIK